MRKKKATNRTNAAMAKELAALAAEKKGVLKPVDVVAFAKDKRTALHTAFEWNDTAAAHAYRLWQARELIRCTVMHHPSVDEPVRAYISLTPDRIGEGGGYRSLDSVLNKTAWREQMLADALEDLERFRAKYQLLKQLAPVFRAAAKVAARQGKRPTRKNGVHKT